MLDFGFYNMDCVEGMKEFPDNYFNLAIVDPPYGGGGSDADAQNTFKGALQGRFGGRFSQYVDTKNKELGVHFHGRGRSKKYLCKIDTFSWDVAPDEEYFNELFRVSKNQIIWGGNYFELPPTRCFVVWRKTNIPEKFSMAMCEYAWTSFNQSAKICEFSSARNKESGKFHPTEKPIKLYEWLINQYAKPDDIILDTHVGSASSLIACHRTNHKYVGFEINKDYYRLAKERLDRETAQLTIFDI